MLLINISKPKVYTVYEKPMMIYSRNDHTSLPEMTSVILDYEFWIEKAFITVKRLSKGSK